MLALLFRDGTYSTDIIRVRADVHLHLALELETNVL